MADGSRGVLVLFAVMASICDLKTGKVPNWLLLPTFLFGVLLQGLSGGAEALARSFCAAGIAIFVFSIFWKNGGLGAGDVKMLAVLSFYMENDVFGACLLFSFLIGAFFALISLFRHRDLHESIPFAVPIGTGILLSLLLEQAGVRYYT